MDVTQSIAGSERSGPLAYPFVRSESSVALPLLLLQASLLHPTFAKNDGARYLRLALIPAVVALSWHTPLPRIGPYNMFVGHWTVSVMLLSFHWGLVDGPCWKIGHDDRKKRDIPPGDPTEVQEPYDPSWPGVLALVKYSLSLLTNLEGVGWSFESKRARDKRPASEPPSSFLPRMILWGVSLHALVLAASALYIPAYRNLHPPDLWTYYFDSPSPHWFEAAAPYIAASAYFVSVWANMEFQFVQLQNIISPLVVAVLRLVLPTRIAPAPYDLADYPPFASRVLGRTSIADFWTHGWHTFLRPSLIVCGSIPMRNLMRPFGKGAMRAGFVFGAFIVSAAIHEYAVYVAIGLDPAFRASKFFLACGVGIICEEGFFHWVQPMMQAWAEGGMQVVGVVEPKQWGLREFLMPNAVTMPAAQ